MSVAKNSGNGFVDVTDSRLFYEVAGSGEPVVLLHGGLLDRRMWDGQFEFLAQHYRVVRYDARYCGKSETKVLTVDYAPYQDLYHIFQALNIEKAALLGLSGGARTAIDFAIAYPTSVRKLVAISPGLNGYKFVDPWTGERGKELMQAFGQGDLAKAIETFVVMWTDGPARKPDQVNPVVRECVREMAINSALKSKGAPTFKELEPPAIGRLNEIHVPTMIVQGEKDTSDIHAICKLLHEQIAGSELVRIPDVAHTLVMEKPAGFNLLVEQFLRA